MPDATVAGRIGQFVIVGLAGTAFGEPFTVQWSAIGNPVDWPTPGTSDARTKQSGQETLSAEYGKVTGIAGNDFYGYIFQQNAITKITYVGGDVVFSFDTFEKDRGCIDFNRYTQVDDLILFQSEKGYHALQFDQITDIGAGIVDKTYTPVTSTRLATVAKNPSIHTVFFDDATMEVPGDSTRGLIYNYKTGQWSTSKSMSVATGEVQTGSIYGLYDVNDEAAQIGVLRKQFNGDTLDVTDCDGAQAAVAILETAFHSDDQDRQLLVDSARIIPYRSDWNVDVETVDLPAATTASVSQGTVNTRTGRYFFRKSGAQQPQARYVSLVVDTTVGTDFDKLNGAEIDVKPGGRQ